MISKQLVNAVLVRKILLSFFSSEAFHKNMRQQNTKEYKLPARKILKNNSQGIGRSSGFLLKCLKKLSVKSLSLLRHFCIHILFFRDPVPAFLANPKHPLTSLGNALALEVGD